MILILNKSLEKEEFIPQTLNKEKILKPQKTMTENSTFQKIMNCFEKFFKIKSDKQFIKTLYYSGDMASIILVQRRIKYWVCRVRKM